MKKNPYLGTAVCVGIFLAIVPLLLAAAYTSIDFLRVNSNYFLPVPTTLSSTATITPDRNVNESFLVTLTNNPTLAIPSNGIEGAIVKVKFYASNVSNNVTLASGYIIPPSMSLLPTSIFTVTTNTTTIVLAEKYGTNWLVTGFNPAYPIP